ncbi:MAG: hypothetical protein ACXWM7_00960 [Parachlamydiaceae bacterium]
MSKLIRHFCDTICDIFVTFYNQAEETMTKINRYPNLHTIQFRAPKAQQILAKHNPLLKK